MKEMELRLVDINLIISNAKNRQVSVSYVNSLAISILENGLLQPPIVFKNSNNLYVILSGHHRIAACKLLLEQGHPEFQYINCFINNDDEIEQELILIDSNLESNPLTVYETMMAIGRKEELLQIKRAAGDLKFKGSMRKYLAQSLSGLEETQVGTYLKIYKKAIDAVKEALKNELITLAEAGKIASYDKNEQLKRLINRNKHNDYNYSKDKCIRIVEESMQSSLSTKVRISNHTIKISYSDTDDLNRILEILGQLESN